MEDGHGVDVVASVEEYLQRGQQQELVGSYRIAEVGDGRHPETTQPAAAAGLSLRALLDKEVGRHVLLACQNNSLTLSLSHSPALRTLLQEPEAVMAFLRSDLVQQLVPHLVQSEAK